MRPRLAALLVTVAVLTSGCLGFLGSSRPPSDQRALDALDRSQTAMADVTSYRTTVDGRVDATANDEQLTLHLTGDVVVNVSARQMNATGRISDTTGAASRIRAGTQKTYITGYTAYTECTRIGWERQNLSQSRPWLTYTPVGQELAVLNRTNVYWQGSETINGTETTVIVAYPTTEELQSVPDVRGTGVTDTLGNANLENMTVTVWLSNETDRPLKARRDIRVTQSGNTATASVTFRFTGYDRPTSVARPRFDEDSLRELGCPGSG